MVRQPEYGADLGKLRHDRAPAKSLIYQTNSIPPEFVSKKQYNHSIPFATCEDTEIEKYPSTFVMRKKADGCPTKIGTTRDFDPEVYRKQIRENRVSKVEGPRRAYVGAGNILSHHEPDAALSVPAAPSHISNGHSSHCMAPNDYEQAYDVADACSESHSAVAE
eukprot:jgi/Ulvmu1/9735/UM055_0075.1